MSRTTFQTRARTIDHTRAWSDRRLPDRRERALEECLRRRRNEVSLHIFDGIVRSLRSSTTAWGWPKTIPRALAHHRDRVEGRGLPARRRNGRAGPSGRKGHRAPIPRVPCTHHPDRLEEGGRYFRRGNGRLAPFRKPLPIARRHSGRGRNVRRGGTRSSIACPECSRPCGRTSIRRRDTGDGRRSSERGSGSTSMRKMPRSTPGRRTGSAATWAHSPRSGICSIGRSSPAAAPTGRRSSCSTSIGSWRFMWRTPLRTKMPR